MWVISKNNKGHLTATEKKYFKIAVKHCIERNLVACCINRKSFFFNFQKQMFSVCNTSDIKKDSMLVQWYNMEFVLE